MLQTEEERLHSPNICRSTCHVGRLTVNIVVNRHGAPNRTVDSNSVCLTPIGNMIWTTHTVEERLDWSSRRRRYEESQVHAVKLPRLV